MTNTPTDSTAQAGPPDVRFSVVIPAFNRESTLPRAIESVLAQDLSPYEVIVIDDGSRDRTAEVAEAFGSRVRVVRQENAGVSAARNRGVREASCPWVAFLDSDDYWTASHLSAMARAIERTGGAARLYFADLQLGAGAGGGSQWARAEFAIAEEHQLVQNGSDWVLRSRIPMMLQASVVKARDFLDEGGLWEKLRTREDTHWFLRTALTGPICAVRHLGTIQTDDDSSGGRLTVALSNQGEVFHVTSILVWSDLLRRFPELPLHGRKLLRRRLASSHGQLARLALRRGRLYSCLREGTLATRYDLLWWARRVLRRFSGSQRLAA